MTESLDRLVMYFEFPFVRYAMIVGVLIALCSSLLGVTLVLKRFSFIGHGLSNVAFGTIAVATAVNLTNNFLLVLPVTIISSVLLLRTGKNAKINGDAAIAMISVGALGIGYLVMNIFPNSANLAGDVCATLFGSTSILTLDQPPFVHIFGHRIPVMVLLCIILSVLVITVFLLFYHKIFAVTFDEDFAAATGVNAKAYNFILAVIIAVIIVLAINLVGTLLISALVIFPALSAMRVFKSFFSVTVCSVVVATVCAVLGILISIFAGTPVGSTIVATQIATFVIFWLTGLITQRL
jgi:zinc transport system permease protein